MKYLFVLVLALSAGIHLSAQTKIIKLKHQPNSYAPREYYVASVIDKRDDTSNIGMMHAGIANKLMPINLQGGAAVAIFNFINGSFKQNTSATPIEIHITKLNIEESFKVNAQQADLTAELEFYSNGTRLNAYTYSSYARASTDVSAYIGTLIKQLMEQCIKDIDGWLAENKNLAAPGISVAVEMLPESGDQDHVAFSLNRPLKRDDFKGEPYELSIAGAVTLSGILIKYRYQTLANQKNVKITVTPYFDKAQSWWREKNYTSEILAHEQLHFDITAIAACGLVKDIQSYTFTADNFIEELEALQKRSEKKRTQMQQQYDKETHHGSDKSRQQEWEKKIKAELAVLTCYEAHE